MVTGLLLALCLLPTCFAKEADSNLSHHLDERLTGQGFIVMADRRIFAVMAFLNAAGYNDEAPGRQMHPVRIKVRKMLEHNLQNSQTKLAKWKKYYQQKPVPIYAYQDFALSMSPEYPFYSQQADNKLGYPRMAPILKDLPQVLNDFWSTAELDKVWKEVKPEYLAELRK